MEVHDAHFIMISSELGEVSHKSLAPLRFVFVNPQELNAITGEPVKFTKLELILLITVTLDVNS